MIYLKLICFSIIIFFSPNLVGQTVIADAGPDRTITCDSTTVTLGGDSTSIGSEFTYSWTDQNLAIISNEAFVEVSDAGTYVLEVTNIGTNGIDTDTVIVTRDVEIPSALFESSFNVLDCFEPEGFLDASPSSSGPDIVYSWFDPDSIFISNDARITITEAGKYTLVVENVRNGCFNILASEFVANQDPPIIQIADPGLLSVGGILEIEATVTSNPNFNEFAWSTSDGNIISDIFQPTISIDQPGLYCLEAINVNGCVSTSCVTVEQAGASTVIADAGPDRTVNCNNPTVTLGGNNTSMGPDFTYEWTRFGNIVSDSAFVEVSQTSPYVLTVTNTVTNETAMDTVQVTLEINFIGVNIFDPEELTCDNNSTTLSILLDGEEGLATEWTTIGGNIISDPTQSFIEVDEPGEYFVVVTDISSGCTGRDSIIVTGDTEIPIVSIAATSPLTCVFSNVLIDGSNSSAGPEFVYSWFDQNGVLIIDSSPTLSFIEANEPGEYTLVVTDTSSGCTATDSIIVTADIELPIASIRSSGILNCFNQEVTLDGSESSAGPEFAYSWFDQNAVLISNEVSINVGLCGFYTLVVENTENGCFSSVDFIVECDDELPLVQIQDPGLLSQGGTLELTGLAASQSSFNFLFIWTTMNGNIISNVNSPNITIDQPGEYCLTVTNLDNGCESQECVVVELSGSPTVIADAGPDVELTCRTTSSTEFCLGGEDLSEGPEFTYEWTTDFGFVVSTERNYKLTEADMFGPSYILQVTNTITGEQALDTVMFVQNVNAPTLDVVTFNSLTCTDTEVIIDVTVISPSEVSFMWEGPSIISDPTAEDITVDEPGLYTVIVENIENGCSSAISIMISENINSLEILLPPQITCDTFRILDPTPIFEQLNSPGSTGSWEEQDGLKIDTFPIAIVTKSGTYTFNKVDPVNGCLDRIIFRVIISDEVVADAGIDQVINCNESAILGEGNTADPNLEYIWTNASGDIVGSMPTIEVDTQGIYTLVIADQNSGCQGSDEVVVEQGIGGPMLMVDVTDVSCFGANDGALLQIASGGSPPYTYTFDSPSEMNLAPGAYTVSVTDALGCIASTVEVIGEPDSLAVEFIVNTDNQLEAIVTGGTGGYTYDWNVEADSNIVSDLINGTTYELTVTDENGCDVADSFLFIVNGIFSPRANELSVFPNPTDGLLHLQMDFQINQELTEVQVFDIQGIQMNMDIPVFSTSKITLDMSQLQTGTYILQAIIDGDLYYQKIIVF